MDLSRKVEVRINNKNLKSLIYYAIIRHAREQNKDRKNIMKTIQNALAKYNGFW